MNGGRRRVSALVSVTALVASVVLCVLAYDTRVTQVAMENSTATVEQTVVDTRLLLAAAVCAAIWLVSAAVAFGRGRGRSGQSQVGDNDRVTDPSTP